MHQIAPFFQHFRGEHAPVARTPPPDKLVAFFVVVALNIDIFKLYLHLNLIKMHQIGPFFYKKKRGSMPPVPPKEITTFAD